MLRHLERPSQIFEHATPNWFASVMGTGIVANAAATLPWQSSALRVFAVGVWVFASLALVALSSAFAMHWWRHRETASSAASDPVMSHFYGAPPMALLTVGAGTLLVGPDVIGSTVALWADAVLWTAGTATGLATSMWLPYRMIVARGHDRGSAIPAWLMPIVPPMVSASTGALLLAHVPPGQPRLSLLVGCYAMFGLSLVLGMLTFTLVYSRLVHEGLSAVQAAPTVWISLGMVGQSVTAVNLLGDEAGLVFSGSQAALADGLRVFGLVYGMAFGGFGVLFFALAVALTVHALRGGLTFSLTWWSFTFPVGTCVTGATALSVTSGSVLVEWISVLLYVVLVVAWVTVAAHTLRGSVTGRVFLPA